MAYFGFVTYIFSLVLAFSFGHTYVLISPFNLLLASFFVVPFGIIFGKLISDDSVAIGIAVVHFLLAVAGHPYFPEYSTRTASPFLQEEMHHFFHSRQDWMVQMNYAEMIGSEVTRIAVQSYKIQQPTLALLHPPSLVLVFWAMVILWFCGRQRYSEENALRKK